LTERESTIATDGSALRPAFCRTVLRKARRMTSQVPSRRPRRRYPYTVFQGGKSFGNGRHWPPVFRTYDIPLISARKSCFGGRPLPRTVGKGFTTYGFSTAYCASLRSLGYIRFILNSSVTRYPPWLSKEGGRGRRDLWVCWRGIVR
jgi:hypothetical protein